MKHKLMAAVCVALSGALFLVQPAKASEGNAPKTSTWTADDGTRVLQQSIDVPAPVKEVWTAFTTTEGFRSWAAPVAQVEMKLGGFMETSYDPKRSIGMPGNIRNEIVAYVPQRMLAIRNREAPPNTPFDAVAFQSLHTVVTFEPLGERSTRVTIAQPGYLKGEPWDTLYKHFEWGNGWTLQQLRKRFTDGPTDWARLLAPREPKK